MEISKDILREWRRLSKWGEQSRIHIATGVSRPTLRKAFREGKCSVTTFEKINNYFLHRPATEKAQEQEVLEKLRTII